MMTTVYDHLVELKKDERAEDERVKAILSGYNDNVTKLKVELNKYLDELVIPVPGVTLDKTPKQSDEETRVDPISVTRVDPIGVTRVDPIGETNNESGVKKAGGIFENATPSQDGSKSDNGHGKYTEKKTKKNQNKTTTYEFTISLEGKFSIQIIGKTTATREYGKIDNVKKLISEAVTQETDKAKEFKEAITNATTYKDIKNAFANYIKKSDGQNVVFDDKTLFIDVLPKGNDLTSLANAVKAEINTSLT
jgi:hypothetical protein